MPSGLGNGLAVNVFKHNHTQKKSFAAIYSNMYKRYFSELVIAYHMISKSRHNTGSNCYIERENCLICSFYYFPTSKANHR